MERCPPTLPQDSIESPPHNFRSPLSLLPRKITRNPRKPLNAAAAIPLGMVTVALSGEILLRGEGLSSSKCHHYSSRISSTEGPDFGSSSGETYGRIRLAVSMFQAEPSQELTRIHPEPLVERSFYNAFDLIKLQGVSLNALLIPIMRQFIQTRAQLCA